MRATCLIARWVTDTSTDLCGISGHWSFKGLLPSKVSTFLSINWSWARKRSTNPDWLEPFFLFFNYFRLGLLLRAMCLAPLCFILLAKKVCPRPLSSNKEGTLELRFTHGSR